ncbi:hypothetical protein TSUD_273610 [Trifolium subterraneum]|uniref:Rho-GAP domain-containing protein n=1 Tax=Trifolium subterraneum TaxID=3900 RepID=A0A2Z6LSS4_TRISU|nr:hypothetical protein TSUD_273610 [Trifolium subterraneum]
MAEVLHSCDPIHIHTTDQEQQSPSSFSSLAVAVNSSFSMVTDCEAEEMNVRENEKTAQELSLLAILVTLFRKTFISCSTDVDMEVGHPTNVRHVAHVTFDRFNGFLGLPLEFLPQVPTTPPSASATVFGVSTESMKLSYDTRGNIVPTILLLMQEHLYAQGGLQAEGIFRINADNRQEEYVRDQLNKGVVPQNIDVHCLADQIMQCQTEEDCAELMNQLPHTEASLLDWIINLMADVVQEEHLNKMNARNIAMVFAPNMTQTLVSRTLRARKMLLQDDNSLSKSCQQDVVATENEVLINEAI